MTTDRPDALILMSPQCSYCPKVVELLVRLLKEGLLGRLEIVNLFEHPEIAQSLGVRSVPWTRIGPFSADGLQDYATLRAWAEQAGEKKPDTLYQHLLANQQIGQVIRQIEQTPENIKSLLPIIDTLDSPLLARIGAGAVIEEFQDQTSTLAPLLPRLIELAENPAQQIRTDAAHYLGLTASPTALPVLQTLAKDEDPGVREIAGDALEHLNNILNQKVTNKSHG